MLSQRNSESLKFQEDRKHNFNTIMISEERNKIINDAAEAALKLKTAFMILCGSGKRDNPNILTHFQKHRKLLLQEY